MTRVRPVSFTDPEARYYIVDGETDGDNALVRRSGELDNVLECLRCGEKAAHGLLIGKMPHGPQNAPPLQDRGVSPPE